MKRRTRLAPIAALGGLYAAAFAAGGACDRPESFHMVGVPTAGVQFGRGGMGGVGGAGGAVTAGGRSGAGNPFGGSGGLLVMGTGGRGNGGAASDRGGAAV